jgi:quercetin dioxygenase-like cupin family protein
VQAEHIEKNSMQGVIARELFSSKEAPNFNLRWFQILPGGHTEFHTHHGEHELYLIRGELLVRSDQFSDLILKEGDFFFIAPEIFHGYYNLTSETCEFLYVTPNNDLKSEYNAQLPKFIHHNYLDIVPQTVSDFGSMMTTIRVLINKSLAPTFIMRRFEILPNGIIGTHGHPWEHEMFFLQGITRLLNEKGDYQRVDPYTFVYMPPNELHGYINEGSEAVAFICLIPNV